MGLQIRDDRQMKALTGLSQAQFDHLLSVFSDSYRGSSTANRGHDAPHLAIRRCSASERRPRRLGGVQRGGGT